MAASSRVECRKGQAFDRRHAAIKLMLKGAARGALCREGCAPFDSKEVWPLATLAMALRTGDTALLTVEIGT